MHHLAPAGADGPPLSLLMPEGLTQTIPWPQFHGLQARPGIGRAQFVVLEIAVAVFIHQDTALAAARLGEQYAGAGQAGRVILDELHVFEGNTRPVGHRHAVGGLDGPIGREGEHPAGPAGGDNHRLGPEQAHQAGPHLDGGDAHATVVLHQQVRAVVFVEALDGGKLERGLEQSVQDVEAALVRSEPGPFDLHPAEGADVDMTVRGAAPGAAPVFELGQFQGGLLDEQINGVLIAQPVSTRHRVMKMMLEAVALADHPGGTALGGHGMTAHRIDFRNQRNLQSRIALGRGDGGAQAGAASPDDRNIRGDDFHRHLPFRYMPMWTRNERRV